MMETFLFLSTIMLYSDSPRPSQVETEIVAHRGRITTGEVELTGRYLDASGGSRREVTLPARRIMFDGPRLRRDAVIPPPEEHPEWPEGREVSSFAAADHYFLSDQRQEDGQNLNVLDAWNKNSFTPNPIHTVQDPRWFGIIPVDSNNLAYSRGLHDVLGRPDRKRTEVTEEVLDGERCTRVEYERNDGTVVTLWVAPERDYNVVKSSMAIADLRDLAETTLARDEASGLWFPARVRYQRTMKGEVTHEEDLTIKVVHLNRPVDPKTFTPGGMDIPAGTPVVRHPRNERGLEWDGRAIVSNKKESPWSSPAPPPTRWPWVAGAIALMLIAATLLWRATARR